MWTWMRNIEDLFQSAFRLPLSSSGFALGVLLSDMLPVDALAAIELAAPFGALGRDNSADVHGVSAFLVGDATLISDMARRGGGGVKSWVVPLPVRP
jgi:hypothetical protein